MTENKKTFWSDCGQVFFDNGNGWGVRKGNSGRLTSIYLGKESDILEMLSSCQLRDNLVPFQKEVMLDVLNYRK